MTPERLREIERLFHDARERPPAEREAFLAGACAGDFALRREVESLLAQAPAGLIDAHLGALVAELVASSAPRLASGSSVGPYRIERLLDVGGMGEVYRARDTILGRDVAIKILPRHFTSDAERLARFEREAQLLATLNHPHIAAIYGVVDAEGVRGLVLEMVEGQTLADRLTAGPLPVDEALRAAHQIAEALEAAHEKGVVHRDLKPANIQITPEGVVKVIDFGLGKALDPDTPGHDSDGAPTMLSGGTRSGLILGTPTYMSPQQARGRPVDKRTDIWAFGCVFYEMLTGRAAFPGKTVPDTLANILEGEPDWDALPANVPDAIQRLLKRCLRKEPAERVHDIADARIEIADASSVSGVVHKARQTNRRNPAAWAAVALGVAALATAVWLLSSRRAGMPARTGVMQFSVGIHDNAGLGMALSPDGTRMAVAECCGGPQLWIYSLDGSEPRVLPGAGVALRPFWSPDSALIGFFADGKVKRIDAAGGPAVAVAETQGGAGGGTWNDGGVIVFASAPGLFQVPASGGTPTDIRPVDGAELRQFPQFLPDNRHFIYHAIRRDGNSVQLGSLDESTTTRLFDSEFPAAFSPPSSLLFLRGTALVAQRFNVATLALEGEASVIAPDVAPGSLRGAAIFSAASNGVLAFMKTRGGSVGQLTWFDREGRAQRSIPQPAGAEYLNPAIAPNGKQVAVNLMDPQTGNWDIWVVDLIRGVPSRITLDPARDADPVWSPDGREIVFASTRGGRFGLYRKVVGGSEPETLIAAIDGQPVDVTPLDWSPDGRFVLFMRFSPPGPQTLWVAPLSGDRKPFLLLDDRFNRYSARVSPDGRWVAYTSFETGTAFEVFVQRFMAVGEKKQISRGGGIHPRWTRDGRELVYATQAGDLMSVALDFPADGLRAGVPKPVITAPVLTLIDGRPHYDATRDGQRFLLRQPVGAQRPAITIMLNWTEKLRE